MRGGETEARPPDISDEAVDGLLDVWMGPGLRRIRPALECGPSTPVAAREHATGDERDENRNLESGI